MVMFNKAQWAGDYPLASRGLVVAEMKNNGDTPLVMRLALDGDGGKFATKPWQVPADAKWHQVFFDLGATSLVPLEAGDVTRTLRNAYELRLLHNPEPGWRGATVAATLGVDNITVGPADFGNLHGTHGIAWHTLSDIYLGSEVDADVGPDSDVNDGMRPKSSDPWPPGGSVELTVVVTGGDGYLVAWIDWDDDGVFENSAPERVIDQAVTAGENDITITVPIGVGYSAGDLVRGRVRLYDAKPSNPRPTGLGRGGEVEDYGYVSQVFLPLVLGGSGE
jgi:hypothetical protein